MSSTRSFSARIPSRPIRRSRWLALATAAFALTGLTGSMFCQVAAEPAAPPRATLQLADEKTPQPIPERRPTNTPAPNPTPASKARTISREQGTAFVTALREASHGKVTVSAAEGDGEAKQFATQLGNLLYHAGYSQHELPVAEIPVAKRPAKHPAVFLFVSSKVPIPAYAMAIKDGLEFIGVRCEFANVEPVGRPGDLQIAVYGKP